MSHLRRSIIIIIIVRIIIIIIIRRRRIIRRIKIRIKNWVLLGFRILFVCFFFFFNSKTECKF